MPRTFAYLATILVVCPIFLISACESSSITEEEAVVYAKEATERYMHEICKTHIISIIKAKVVVDAYIDSGPLYRVTQYVSVDGREPFQLTVEVPKVKYDDQTNAAMMGGEIFFCRGG